MSDTTEGKTKKTGVAPKTKAKKETAQAEAAAQTETTETSAESTDTSSKNMSARTSEIKDDVSMPAVNGGRRAANYGFDQMKKGQMFFVDPKRMSTVRSAANTHVKRLAKNGVKEDELPEFTVRQFPNDHPEHAGKAGCWRVK